MGGLLYARGVIAAAVATAALVLPGPNVRVRDAAGVHVVTPPLARGEQRRDGSAVVAPGGARVAFVRYSPRHRGIYVVDLDGRHLRALQLLETTEQVRSLAWSPDGSALLVAVNGFKPGFVERIAVDTGARLDIWTFPGARHGTTVVYGWSRFAATLDEGPSTLYAVDPDGAVTAVAHAPGAPPPDWRSG